MRLPYRFFLVIQALVVLIFTAFGLALLYGWSQPVGYLKDFTTVPANRWGLLAVGIILILISLYLIIAAFRASGGGRQAIIIQETGLGRVEIAAEAVEDLICRASRQLREIREVRPVLQVNIDGLTITLHLNVIPDADLPVVTKEVQQIVQQYLEEKAGVRVLQIMVRVDSVSLGNRPRVE
jgi:uncharacterized alkaline shock family protein YloU